jgi:SAM-dependent methyltransferase
MKETVWDNNWGKLHIDALSSTSLGRFGEEAYKCFRKYITNDDLKILEAGSGTGRFCIALGKDFPDSVIYGVDISRHSTILSKTGAKLHNVNNIEFIQGDIFKIPSPDNFFDIVFNEGVIEHFHNYEKSIEEMIRVAKPSGKIIIAVPNWYCFPHTIYKKIIGDKFEYGYEKSFKHDELVKAMEELGLKDIEIAGFYPAHGIKRLAKYCRLFHVVGNSVDFAISKLDHFTNNSFSNYFGFEIVVKGIKK